MAFLLAGPVLVAGGAALAAAAYATSNALCAAGEYVVDRVHDAEAAVDEWRAKRAKAKRDVERQKRREEREALRQRVAALMAAKHAG